MQAAMATGGADLMNAVVIGATGATGKCLVGSMLKAKVVKHIGMGYRTTE